jgi:hypothetical protein
LGSGNYPGRSGAYAMTKTILTMDDSASIRQMVDMMPRPESEVTSLAVEKPGACNFRCRVRPVNLSLPVVTNTLAERDRPSAF